ncbi:MAG: hypothetical protein GX208_07765 [Firmicutes bacterium]|nr:hypothetical protein [Bacillota bacterium]
MFKVIKRCSKLLLLFLCFIFMSTAAEAKTIIYVDGSQESDPAQNRYKTVTEAVAAAPYVTREADRVIIEIADGVYREQIIVDKPYLTFRSASGDPEKVVLTWYYGIGYVYNNVGTDGFYDPNVDWSADATWEGLTRYNIGDSVSTISYYDKNGVLHQNKSVKGGVLGKPDRWGCAVKLERSATGFIAENITFESSFNFYVTQEEIDAGVTPEPQPSIKPARAHLGAGSTEVEKEAYTERAAALHTDSDRTIIRNCIIRSKQDTLYVGSNRILFDNCTIMGGTDYIYGGATAVFNQCNLVFAGYTDTGKTGTITAGAHASTDPYGYLFWNCVVDYRLDKRPNAGNLGRPWSSPLGAQVTFIGTTIKSVQNISLIGNEGWTNMSNTQKDEARFYEYGSVDEQGLPIDTSMRVVNRLAPMGSVINEWQALEFNPYNYLKGTDGWDPLGLAEQYQWIYQVIQTVKIDSNVAGDIVVLPEAPTGYVFAWESDSPYAVVSEDGKTVRLIRPAFGEPTVNATVTLYVKDLANGHGDKKAIAFPVTARTTADNSFNVKGTVSLAMVSDKNVNVDMVFVQDGVILKKAKVQVPKGQKTVDYLVEYLPAGSYEVLLSADQGHRVGPEEIVQVAGQANETKTLNVRAGILETIVIETADFVEAWATPIANGSNAGFDMIRYISNGDESANLGSNNVVYKFIKAEGVILPPHIGGYWDLLAAIKAKGNSLENTDTLRFSFDFLLESTSLMSDQYSYFDLVTSLANQGNSSEDQTRFLRWGLHRGWRQINMFNALNTRINGDRTQLHVNDKMANKWYRIVADIDLNTQMITTTLYNRDENTILNQTAFEIAVPDVVGNSPAFPKEIDLNQGLFFAVYMDNYETAHQMEFYFDNFRLEFQDFKTE